jgi:UDPglucose 6-dehydrogenase
MSAVVVAPLSATGTNGPQPADVATIQGEIAVLNRDVDSHSHMNNLLIGVVGLSHLGVTASTGLASLGFQILGVDSDQETVRRLQQGDCIFPEPSLPELLASHRARMGFTTDFAKLAACDVVIFGQDTFITEQNEMELSRIHALIGNMIPHLRQDVTILFMSQVPVGFTRALSKSIRDQRKNVRFRLHYWVDVLVVGDAVSRFLKPGRVIIGHQHTPEPLSEPVSRILQSFQCPIIDMNYESAEITKSAVNVYLATTVTFANALSDVCEAVGADMTQIIPALRLDKRIGAFAYVKPGLGFSGGHLERDLVALSRLARSHGVNTSVLDLIQEESAGRYHWLTKKIELEIFAEHPFPTIALWGLSYKKNTDSTHGAPSLKVIRDCAKRSRLVAYDPLVHLPSDLGVTTVDDRYATLEGADGLIILSDWDEFKTLDIRRLKQAMETPLIIDPLGVLADIDFTHEDVSYIPMGRSRV